MCEVNFMAMNNKNKPKYIIVMNNIAIYSNIFYCAVKRKCIHLWIHNIMTNNNE